MPPRSQSRLRSVARRLAAVPEPDPRLHGDKTRALDHLFRRMDVRSLADLGGIWAVDGAYTLYALERNELDRAILVDERHSEPLAERARDFPQLELCQGNFGVREVAERVGEVDAVMLFDVLLHQVSPDWTEVVSMYASGARALVISQPQYVGGSDSVRLIDLGRERYLGMVPKFEAHDLLFDRLDEIDPVRGRPYRDVHDVWQWGITDADLRRAVEAHGFELSYYENVGAWQGLPDFDKCAFVFLRP